MPIKIKLSKIKLKKLIYKTQELFKRVTYQDCWIVKTVIILTRYLIVVEIKGKIKLKKEKYKTHNIKITQTICVKNDNLSNE